MKRKPPSPIRYFLNGEPATPPLKPRREHGPAWGLTAPKPPAEVIAERWARWHCERLGIEWPKPDLYPNDKPTVMWDHERERDVCFCIVAVWHPEKTRRLYRPSKRCAYRYVDAGWETTPGYAEELLRIEIPPWAMPCKRTDLWHAAHQAGASWAECIAEGQGYGPRAAAEADARCAKLQATRWAKTLQRLVA